MSQWPMVRLGEVLQHRKEFIEINDLESYKRCRVQLHAQGIVLRDQVPGAEIKTKKQQVCKAGEFLVAEIDAKIGGYGIVPPDLEGSIVSSHYFLFEIDASKLDRRFLGYYIKTPAFFEQVAAQGSTNYAAIRPGHVLNYAIPLPALSDQVRLVDQLSELNAKIDQAKSFRTSCNREIKLLKNQLASHFGQGRNWPFVGMEDLVGRTNLKNGISLKSDPLGSEIHCLTLSSMRDGRIDLSESKPVPLTQDDARPYLVDSGDVFIVRGNGSKDLVGRAGMVNERRNNIIFPDLFIKVPLPTSQIIPSFFVHIWNSTMVRAKIEEIAKTTSGIWKINQGHIASISVPVPSIEEQTSLVERINQATRTLDSVASIQKTTEAELHAFLPAVLNRAFQRGA